MCCCTTSVVRTRATLTQNHSQFLFCRLSTTDCAREGNTHLLCCFLARRALFLEHGSNNVSRWMTWLPISLKNAAKCDKWYQLQNHSITESLNAKGAWEKLFTSHPRACRISVSNKQPLPVSHEFSRLVLHLWGSEREPIDVG